MSLKNLLVRFIVKYAFIATAVENYTTMFKLNLDNAYYYYNLPDMIYSKMELALSTLQKHKCFKLQNDWIL